MRVLSFSRICWLFSPEEDPGSIPRELKAAAGLEDIVWTSIHGQRDRETCMHEAELSRWLAAVLWQLLKPEVEKCYFMFYSSKTINTAM